MCFTQKPFSALTDCGPFVVFESRDVMFSRQVVGPTGSSKSRCERLWIPVSHNYH